MNHTSRLSLPLLHSGQAQKEITHNEALMLLDILIHPVIEAIYINNPQEAKKVGGLYIIGAKPKKEFAKYPGHIAQKLEHGWQFVKPLKWMIITMNDDGSRFIFNGDNWIRLDQNQMDTNNTICTTNTHNIGQEKKLSTNINKDNKQEKDKDISSTYLIKRENGEYLRAGHMEEILSLDGLYTDTKNIIIPHHSVVIAVNVRVIETITGADNFTVGTSNQPKIYGSDLGIIQDTSNVGLTDHLLTYWDDTPIRITAGNNGRFTGGKVLITIQYLHPHGPWDWD